jgi:hypothetical protein
MLVLDTLQKTQFRRSLVTLLLQALDSLFKLSGHVLGWLDSRLLACDVRAYIEQVAGDELHVFLCEPGEHVKRIAGGTVIVGDFGQFRLRLLVVKLEALGGEIDGAAAV